MGTKIYKLYGEARWAKIRHDQLDLDFNKKDKSWKLDLYPTPGSLDLIDQSGLQLKKRYDKKTNEGPFIKFSRKEFKIFNDEVKPMGPPTVVDKDGTPITCKVGNGSKVQCVVEVYDSRNGKGHTLTDVIVHELVPYEDGPEVFEEDIPF